MHVLYSDHASFSSSEGMDEYVGGMDGHLQEQIYSEAYNMAIARGLPRVVPSVNDISPHPTTSVLCT